ncbi:YSC84-related protein [Shimia biformata]|uniref:lipid-binding SYLF domain-containing protein n=1 Tax=Shimia biformata TaxID=1294299 RepID=UPI00194EBDF8|nr:YSC84-related protein [Shimia biformata]
MTNLTRRGFAFGALAGAGVTAACGNGIGNSNAQVIDARVAETLNYLYTNYPNTLDLGNNAKGVLVMPVVTEAGLGFGGGYGQGALQVNGTSVDYYSATKGSVGLQFGASQHAHVLFFMTEGALSQFRSSSGWAVGANVKYVVVDEGGAAIAETTNILQPVVAVIFGQAGIKLGVTLEGTKYNRIIP